MKLEIDSQRCAIVPSEILVALREYPNRILTIRYKQGLAEVRFGRELIL